MMNAAWDFAGLRKIVCGDWGRRSGIGIAIAIGLIVATPGAALASAGCTALNGTFTGGAISGSTSGTGFSAGDIITLTVTAVGGGDALGLYDNTNHNPLLLSTNAVGSRTYAVSANTPANFIISGTQLNAGSNFSWSCAAGGGSTVGSTDSKKLTTVQETVTSVVANQSGTAISESVGSAIAGALSGSTGGTSGSGGTGSGSSGSGSSGTLPKLLTREEYGDASGMAAVKFFNVISSSPRTTDTYKSSYANNVPEYDQLTASGYVVFLKPDGSPNWVLRSSLVSQFAAEPPLRCSPAR